MSIETRSNLLRALRDRQTSSHAIPPEIHDMILTKLVAIIPQNIIGIINEAHMRLICDSLIGQIDHEALVIKHRLRNAILHHRIIDLGLKFARPDSAGTVTSPVPSTMRDMAQSVRHFHLTITIDRPEGLRGYIPQYPAQLYLAIEQMKHLTTWLLKMKHLYLTIEDTGPKRVMLHARTQPGWQPRYQFDEPDIMSTRDYYNQLITLIGEIVKLNCGSSVRLLLKRKDTKADRWGIRAPKHAELALGSAVKQHGRWIAVNDTESELDLEGEGMALSLKAGWEAFEKAMSGLYAVERFQDIMSLGHGDMQL